MTRFVRVSAKCVPSAGRSWQDGRTATRALPSPADSAPISAGLVVSSLQRVPYAQSPWPMPLSHLLTLARDPQRAAAWFAVPGIPPRLWISLRRVLQDRRRAGACLRSGGTQLGQQPAPSPRWVKVTVKIGPGGGAGGCVPCATYPPRLNFAGHSEDFGAVKAEGSRSHTQDPGRTCCCIGNAACRQSDSTVALLLPSTSPGPLETGPACPGFPA